MKYCTTQFKGYTQNGARMKRYHLVYKNLK